MTEWLSDQWVSDSGTAVQWTSPFSAVVQVTVTGGAEGEIRYHRRYQDGRVVAAAPGPAEAPDVALTVPVAEARQMLEGQLDPSVAFMQGRLKTAGDNGLLLEYLAAWSSPAGVASRARMWAMVDPAAGINKADGHG